MFLGAADIARTSDWMARNMFYAYTLDCFVQFATAVGGDLEYFVILELTASGLVAMHTDSLVHKLKLEWGIQ